MTLPQTAVDLVRAVSGGELTCGEVVAESLEVIGRRDPGLHAFVSVAAAEAEAEAERLDRERAESGRSRPLAGLPISAKDALFTRTGPASAGSRTLAGWRPPVEATLISRAREAGAIVMGTTTMPEFGMGANLLETRNALDDGVFTGGSSTGSAVSVAAGMVLASFGTDSAGSGRVPAALNGIVGLKPTAGLLSRYGVHGGSPTHGTMAVLARTVADVSLVCGAVQGHDPRDRGSLEPGPSEPREQLRIGIARQLWAGSSTEVEAGARIAVERLAAAGVEAVEVDGIPFEAMSGVTEVMLAAEGGAAHRGLLEEAGERYFRGSRNQVQAGMLVPMITYRRAAELRKALQARLREIYECHGIDALLFPTLPVHDIPADADVLGFDPEDPHSLATQVRNNGFSNLMGLPAVSVPVARSSSAVPVSAQLVGRPLDEATLLSLAGAMELPGLWGAARAA